MRRKEIIYSCYSTRIILLIGETEEVVEFISKIGNKKSTYFSRERKKDFDISLEKLAKSTGIRGATILGGKNLEKDQNLIIAAVKTDSIAKKLKRDLQSKSFYRTAFHENRHVVDKIVMMNGLHFEDLENTARIQADLDIEFMLLVDQYLKEKEV